MSITTQLGCDEHCGLPAMTTQQSRVLQLIKQFYRVYGEPPTVSLIARHLKVHHRAVQDHIDALYRKGWLRAPFPGGLHCTHVQ